MKDIQGFEGSYAINEQGEIWSYPRWGTRGGWVKKYLQYKGYEIVYLGLGKRSESKTFFVHRLVAKTFIPNPNNLPEINHKNCVKLNNRVENLEWCTHLQNMQHAYANGLVGHARGEDNPRSKINQRKANRIRKSYANGKITQRQLARLYGVNQRLIWSILHKKIWNYLSEYLPKKKHRVMSKTSIAIPPRE